MLQTSDIQNRNDGLVGDLQVAQKPSLLHLNLFDGLLSIGYALGNGK